MAKQAVKVRASDVSKIFGPSPEEAVSRLREGQSKDEIYEQSGNVVAVADVDFEVGQGEIFVVMGLSGSGKSTLVRCINRLIEPTSGSIEIDGEEIVGLDTEQLRQLRLAKVSMVFQHFALFPHRTVGENVEFGLKIKGAPPQERRERALEALDLVGLKAWADAAPDNLSGGMQQRVGLARGLAVNPEVLLMDEPFSALDPLIRREMQVELLQLQRRIKMTILFITHDLHEALILGNKIAIMKDGRFVQVGTPEQIVTRPADDYVASFTQDVDRGRVVSAGSIARDARAVARGETDRSRLRAALEGADSAFLVDEEGRPVGRIEASDLARANGDLQSLAHQDFPSADAEEKLADLFDRCAGGRPIAVMDEDRRLIGQIHPLDVFAELGGEQSKAA
jgi:glycine betaine/proline transport system ATP-binding protein